MFTIKLRKVSKLIGACCLLAASGFAGAEHKGNEVHTLIGRVVNVFSGDNLQVLLPQGGLVSIKLAGIKAPNKDTPFGELSKAWLTSQLHGQLVSADCERTDGLLYCVVFPDDRDINRVSLYHGYSISHETKSNVQNNALYELAEQHARVEKVGVWANTI